ncbi:ribosome biogenesis protein SLX9-domain-containing protein [Phyllosticta citribraziliensis]|uniref:Ribosome biogenesis protein SLX9 n=1 Tax=Phyllosticta citribraziliensis TaxID=989973 RepID=A0ABR1M450_9PEZI
MAPVTKRKSLRSKASAASKPTTTASTTTTPTSVTETPFPSFASSKRDKRTIKHSLLLSKITKSAPGSSAAGKKRRRPNKKLVTTLDALADALPDSSDAAAATTIQSPAAGDGDEGGHGAAAVDVPGAQARILVKDRSLKSRPGALKRKAAIEARERQRFEQNLAEMAKGVPAQQQQQQQQQQDVGMAEAPPAAEAASTADRWKALRAFIGGTMERR